MLALRAHPANNIHPSNNHQQQQQQPPAMIATQQPSQQQQQYDFRSVFAEHSARRSPKLSSTGNNHNHHHYHAMEPQSDFGGSNHSVPSMSQHQHQHQQLQHSASTRSHSSSTKAVSHDDVVGHHAASDARPTVPPHSSKAASAATPAVPLHQQQPAASSTKNNRRLGRQESRYTSGNYTLMMTEYYRTRTFIYRQRAVMLVRALYAICLSLSLSNFTRLRIF